MSAEQVFARNSPIANGSEVLWERVKAELDRAVAEGSYCVESEAGALFSAPGMVVISESFSHAAIRCSSS